MVIHGAVSRARPHRLSNLTDAETLESTCLEPHRLRAEVGQDVRGAREQEIAGEDRDGVTPPGVRGFRASASRGLIHHIVVIEGREMGQLHDHGRWDDPGGGVVAVLRRQEGQQRSKPLAAGGDQVP